VKLSQVLMPLRHPPFRRQFAAQTVSNVGNSLAPVALAFGVLQTTGSVEHLGLVMAASAVPMLVFMLVGGVWADRVARHTLMVVSDLVRCVGQVGLGVLLLTGSTSLWALMISNAIVGTGTAFNTPASVGLTALTTPPQARQQANALLSLVRHLTGIAGPLIAGVLVVTVGAGWALILDGISFAGCALLLWGIRLPALQRNRSTFVGELRAGWREIRKRPWVGSSILYFSLFNLIFAMFIVIGPAALVAKPGGALQWSAIAAGLSAGTVAGNLLALRVMPRHLIRTGRMVELLVVPVIVALALDAPAGYIVATAVLMGIGMSFPDALWYTALQQEIPEDTLSRVSSVDFLGSYALRPIGYTLAPAAVLVGAKVSLLVIAAVFVIATLVTLLIPKLVRLERPRPTGDPAPALDSPEQPVH
jgi:Major Facilitator Superfamily